MTQPPIKDVFVPFRLAPGDGISKEVAEIVNRNLDMLRNGFRVLAQRIQTNYVAIPGTTGVHVTGLSFNAAEEQSDGSGLPVVAYEFMADLTNMPAGNLGISFAMQLSSSAGTGTASLWAGGAFGALGSTPSGTMIGSVPWGSSTYTSRRINGLFTNPVDMVPIQIALQSSSGAASLSARRIQGAISAV